MRPRRTHRFDLSPAEAIRLQKEMRSQVVMTGEVGRYRLVAGADVAVAKGVNRLVAAVVVLEYPGATVVETAAVSHEPTFPYIPGLLSFRETPALLEAFEKLHHTPDVLLADGQGYAHPRGFGLACHIGTLLDLPTIGCAKSRLCGEHDEPERPRGSHVPLVFKGEIVGAVLRTQDGVQPLYVSIGHRVSLDEAVRIVLETTDRYRLPEPSRQAHLEADRAKRLLAAGKPLPAAGPAGTSASGEVSRGRAEPLSLFDEP